jgi:hypothetical protein
VFGAEDDTFQRCILERDCIRLITYPEGEEISAELHPAEPAYGDTTRRLSLIPRAPLEDRWYAAVTNLPSVGGTTTIADRHLARFRPDSHPILSHAWVGTRDGRGVAELRFSERVVGSAEAARWLVRDSGGSLACDIAGPRAGHEEHRAVISCPLPIHDHLTVEFGELATVLGTRVEQGGRPVTEVSLPAPDDELRRVVLFDIES